MKTCISFLRTVAIGSLAILVMTCQSLPLQAQGHAGGIGFGIGYGGLGGFRMSSFPYGGYPYGSSLGYSSGAYRYPAPSYYSAPSYSTPIYSQPAYSNQVISSRPSNVWDGVSDLKPGMVLADGAIVVSVGPSVPANKSSETVVPAKP